MFSNAEITKWDNLTHYKPTKSGQNKRWEIVKTPHAIEQEFKPVSEHLFNQYFTVALVVFSYITGRHNTVSIHYTQNAKLATAILEVFDGLSCQMIMDMIYKNATDCADCEFFVGASNLFFLESDFQFEGHSEDSLIFRLKHNVLQCEYNASQYMETTIIIILDSLKYIAQQIAHDPHVPIEMVLCSSQYNSLADYKCINDRFKSSSPFISIKSLFEEQVEKNRNAVLFVKPCDETDIYINYGEANSQANCIAHYLLSRITAGNDYQGVAVTNGNISNFANWSKERFQYKENDVALQCLSSAFDGFNANFYPQIISGSTIVLLDENMRKRLDNYTELIERYSVTNLAIVPSMLQQALKRANRQWITVRKLILGGEHIGTDLLALCKQHIPLGDIINEYGLTETTVAIAGYKSINQENLFKISYLAKNCEIYILNRHCQLMPVGLPGEIYVGGSQIATGYTDPEETKQRFINNNQLSEGTLFATGDEGVFLHDGSLIVYGRLDEMFKVNGNKIELKGVESCINALPYVDSCAIVQEALGVNKIIHAFVVGSRQLSTSILYTDLHEKLPRYMIPAKITIVPELFLSNNGKIDIPRLQAYEKDECSIRLRYNTSLKQTLQDLGIQLWTLDISDKNPIMVLKVAMVSGYKVAIGLDIFYMPNRNDTYHKQHYPHVVCVAGFDDQSEQFTIIEQANMKTKSFKEINVPYSDLSVAMCNHHNRFSTCDNPDLLLFTKSHGIELNMQQVFSNWLLHLLIRMGIGLFILNLRTIARNFST